MPSSPHPKNPKLGKKQAERKDSQMCWVVQPRRGSQVFLSLFLGPKEGNRVPLRPLLGQGDE